MFCTNFVYKLLFFFNTAYRLIVFRSDLPAIVKPLENPTLTHHTNVLSERRTKTSLQDGFKGDMLLSVVQIR